MKTMNQNKSKSSQAQEHDNLKADADKSRDRMITSEIQSWLKKHNLFPEITCYKGIICVGIEWGDWKHDHIYCTYLMGKKGYKEIDEKLTEENGSDCYSSIHTYIPKNTTIES